MAVSYISKSAASIANPGTSLTITMPSHQAGDLLLVTLHVYGGGDTTNMHCYPPAGWHWGPCVDYTPIRLISFWKIATSGSESNPTFNFGSSMYVGSILTVYRGVDQAKPIRRYSGVIGNDDLIPTKAQSTEVDGTMAVIAYTWYNNATVDIYISDATWTERSEEDVGSALSYGMYTKAFASAGSTGAPTINRSTNNEFCSFTLIIQPSDSTTKADIKVKTGTITCPGSTGNQDTTVGFDVKALLIFSIGVSDGNVTEDAELMFGAGADDGVTGVTQGCVGMWHDSGGTSHSGYSRNGEIVGYYTAGNSTLGSPDMLATYSKITNGFRLNWTAVSSGKELRYIALGGADLRATMITCSADTASHTGYPWAPDFLFGISQCIDGWTDQIRTTAAMMLGFAGKGGASGCWSLSAGPAASNFNHVVSPGAFSQQTDSSTLTWRNWISEWLSNGFSWTGFTNADDVQVLALNFNGKRYYLEGEVANGDASGVADTNQDDVIFANGESIAAMLLFGADSNSDQVNDTLGSSFVGSVQVSGGLNQYSGLFTRTGNTSERARDTGASVLADSNGDIGTPGESPTFERRGVYQDKDTIKWVVNNTTRQIYFRITFAQVGQLFEQSISDSVSSTDALARSVNSLRAISETINATDLLNRSLGIEKLVTDAVGISDLLSRGWEFHKPVSDAVGVLDLLSSGWEFHKLVSDAIGASDLLSSGREFHKPISDSAEISDLLSIAGESTKSVSDSIDVTPSHLLQDGYSYVFRMVKWGPYLYWTDDTLQRAYSLPISGGVPSLLASGQSMVAGIAVDGINVYLADKWGGAIRKVPIGGGSVTDLATGLNNPGEVVTDGEYVWWTTGGGKIQRIHCDGSGSVEDIVTGQGTIQGLEKDDGFLYWITNTPSLRVRRVAKDGGSVTNVTNAQASNGPMTLTLYGDWVIFTNGTTVVHVKKVLKTAVENNGATFAFLPSPSYWPLDLSVAGDWVYFEHNGAIKRYLIPGINVGETLYNFGASTPVSGLVAYRSSVYVGISNQRKIYRFGGDLDFELSMERLSSDSMDVAEEISQRFEFGRSASDEFEFSDELRLGQEMGLSAGADSLVLNDEVRSEVDQAQALADEIGAEDRLEQEYEGERKTQDSATLVETIGTELQAEKTETETLEVLDEVAKEETFERKENDTVGMEGEWIEIEAERFVGSFDSLTLTERTNFEARYLRDFSSSLSLSETLAVGVTFEVRIADTMTLIEDCDHFAEYDRTFVDGLAISDFIYRGNFFLRDFSDTLSIDKSEVYGQAVPTVLLTPRSLYEFLIEPVRMEDQRVGNKLLWRWLLGPQLVWERLVELYKTVPELWDVEKCPDELLQYLKRIVGWTPDLSSITDGLSYDELRRLISVSVPMWRRRGPESATREILYFATGARNRILNWFDYRWIMEETGIWEEHAHSDPWVIAHPGEGLGDEYWSTIRIVDNGALNRDLVLSLLRLMRPSGENFEVFYLGLLDLFEKDADFTQWNPTLTDATVSVSGGTMEIDADSASGVGTLLSSVNWADFGHGLYTVKAKVESSQSSPVFEMRQMVSSDGLDYYSARIVFGVDGNSSITISKVVGGSVVSSVTYTRNEIGIPIYLGAWYAYRFEISDHPVYSNWLRFYVDNVLVHDDADYLTAFVSGNVGLGAEKSVVTIDEVEVMPLPLESDTIEINS